MSTDPTTPQPRVIVLCFDGTADQYDAANTNVVKFYALLDKCCPLEQIVYYQPGIGTFFKPGMVSPALTWVAKMADEAVAWYLNEHVMGGYQFLMQNYRAGDKVCLFGFSRGAYTARALAGFLYKIGLLPRDNVEQIPFAYSLYKRTDNDGLAAGFKETFCTPVTIDFLGVWDTVASVGLVYSRDLPFTAANAAVRVFRHALSLDEHRARFQPNMFHREAPQDATKGKDVHQSPNPGNVASGQEPNEGTNDPAPFPDVQEVWFAGCHSDVGGSAVEDTVLYSLANISLRWMVKQVELSHCGIKFDTAALRKADMIRSPTQPAEGLAWPREQDVRTAIHDQLKAKPLWLGLEILPMKFTWQDPDGTWGSKWGVNLGKGRQIRDEHPNFHKSVRERMDASELKYKPKATWKEGTEQYVD